MKFSEEEYERLLVENQERIYRLALRIIGNREEALDVTQETLAAAYQQREKFRGEAKISTYLYRIGLNYAFASLKKRKRLHLPIDSIGERPGNLDSPAQALAKKERARRMELLLDGLPARQKAAVHLRIYD
ncbi:MAG TPA: sigma-70 family RNA polymerase sigma factor, partial [bacterium]|nr:sigma-70 family RNA polymerase sigma factor [bacterium]